MLLLIFYIWIIDLFLYSNTEIFVIFFIFSSFGVLFYSLVTWYSEYLDELIVSENQKIYFLIFSLKKKISLLKAVVINNRVTVSGEPMKFLPVISYDFKFAELFNAFYVFAEVLFYVNFVNFCFLKYKNYMVYLKTLLVQFYKSNLARNRLFVNQNFLDFKENTLALKGLDPDSLIAEKIS